MRAPIVLLSLSLFASTATFAATAQQQYTLKAGQIVCGNQAALEDYEKAVAAAGKANPSDFLSCRKAEQAAAIVVLIRQSKTRLRVQVTDGPNGGFSGWVNSVQEVPDKPPPPPWPQQWQGQPVR